MSAERGLSADGLSTDSGAEADAPYHVRVAELPEAERPRERLERLGPGALKSEELLAILLRTGTQREGVLQVAGRLVRERGGLRGLAATDLVTLASIHGVGPAKATTIAAAFELGRRAALEDGISRPQVTGPADIARLLHAEMEVLPQEELRLLVLDTKHRVLASTMLYRGTVSAAPGRVAELFREAVRHNAAKIAIAHNHPSGDPTPSPDDIAFTRDVVAAGELLDIPVLDHIVFGHGPDRFVSMRERSLGFDTASPI
jgi:DNA repair protein RadC